MVKYYSLMNLTLDQLMPTVVTKLKTNYDTLKSLESARSVAKLYLVKFNNFKL